MNLTLDDQPDRNVVRIDEPRLDAALALPFKDRMREIVARAPVLLVVDMAQVQFMDSSGLGALIAIHKALPRGTRMELIGVHPTVMRVFRLTRMDTVFTIRVPDEGGPSADGSGGTAAARPAGEIAGEIAGEFADSAAAAVASALLAGGIAADGAGASVGVAASLPQGDAGAVGGGS